VSAKLMVRCDTSVYLTNNQRLDLGLVGQSDRSAGDIQKALAKHPGVYVADVKAAAPSSSGSGSGSGSSSGGSKP
jgi:hypothetical protein